jgi:anti-sigma factor RsiW
VNCKECTEFIQDYVADELPASQRRVFEGHLQLCPPCLTFLDNYKKTLAIGKLCCEEQEEPLPEALVQAILAARGACKPGSKP